MGSECFDDGRRESLLSVHCKQGHSRACMENINKFLAQMTKGDSELYFGRSIFSWVMRAHILGRRVHIVNVLANLY